MIKNLSLYIHIPFCKNRCHYCDFYSNTDCSNELQSKYTKALITSMNVPIDKMEYSIDTVYFGGGTPTMLDAENLVKIIKKIQSSFNLSDDCEITVETNPNSAKENELKILKDNGVNRISIGLQSLNNDILADIGRTHNSDDFFSCFNAAVNAGIKNISVDIMYGLPEQSSNDLFDTINKVLALGEKIKHISLYGLKLEEGTRMYNKRNSYEFPVEDEEADMYFEACELLRNNKFEHYEISNFARSGYRSKHNLKYWTCGDFLGFGASAHSRFLNKLFYIEPDIHNFIESAFSGKNIFEISNYNDVNTLTVEEINEVYIMMSLRTSDGLNLKKINITDSFFAKIQKYINAGFMHIEGDNCCMTERAFYISNSILADLI
ncbi:MAG: hypothetical protein A2Y17_12915 [Clostridiales bacterium GWF2_38_85]|nr:MAG: hypothetical protein A2Y17_12915 [Clostridiales bacterium GWF2_38_85]HBL84160.1 hypothetical protein [Clostridiales bacterium]